MGSAQSSPGYGVNLPCAQVTSAPLSALVFAGFREGSPHRHVEPPEESGDSIAGAPAAPTVRDGTGDGEAARIGM